MYTHINYVWMHYTDIYMYVTTIYLHIIYRVRLIYSKELAHVILQGWQAQICKGRAACWIPKEDIAAYVQRAV